MIKVNNVNKKYKSKVLDNISFEVGKGEMVAIVGANGCGKTTLLNIMCRVKEPDSGEIYYNNELATSRRIVDKYVGYVPQGNPLIEELSVKDNLRLWYKGKNFKAVLSNGAVKMLGVDEFLNKTVSKISGGMKRRLSIAMALINDAKIVILDEPTAALDLVCKKEIMDYLKEYTSSGGTVLMTTHDESEIALCDKVYVIKNGVLKMLPKGTSGSELVNKL